MLNITQLTTAVANAQKRFQQIKEKYPGLKAYLVLSLPTGQVDLGSSPASILKQAPDMVFDDNIKKTALNLTSQLDKSEKKGMSKEEANRLSRQLELLIPQLKYNDNIQVEIRFKDLKYELVWKLQADELVDRELTPQTKASIRIVLGAVGRLAG